MKYLVDSSEAKFIDSYTINETGIPSLVLMERASLLVAKAVTDLALECCIRSPKICVVCGSGNNGGDGIACARILSAQKMDVCILLTTSEEKMSPDAAMQLKIARNLEVPVVLDAELDEYDFIVDAVFGIGLSRDISGVYEQWIDKMDAAHCKGVKVIAVDIASGINADNGRVMGTAVHADVTVTFQYEKPGHYLFPGHEYTGKLICEPIGFDLKALCKANVRHFCYSDECLNLLPARQKDANKGTYGKVLVVAGSKNMAGAAYFSAMAAYRMGTGLVTILTPECNRVILQQLLPEAVMKTYDDNCDMEMILKEALPGHQVVVIGPGLGRSKQSESIVKQVIMQTEVPMIIDADALNILSEHKDWLSLIHTETAITPHLKEFSRLTGYNIQYIKENFDEVCEAFSMENGVICILKDARTRVADGDGHIFINISGNDGMSVGGSGDVLTGIIAGLCAQGMPLKESSMFGVYIHGRSGDKAADKLGRRSMTASDLLEGICELLMAY